MEDRAERQPPSRPSAGGVLGADVGATLVKIAYAPPGAPIDLHLLPRDAIERVAAEVESAAPARVGLTGAGASELSRHLSMDTARIDEFDAWRRGADILLAERGPAPDRYLLVSLGTGTSVMLVDGGNLTRVGGTALGGGTLVGLGAGLLGESGFDELARLASRGDRRRVDLLVGEIGDVPLPGDVTASSLAKLSGSREGAYGPADVAHAIVGLIGENVALVSNALAAAHGAPVLVFAGSTLRGNPTLGELLRGLTLVLGRQPVLLERGEYSGALGALQLALEG